MTVAMLLYNTVDSCKRSNAANRILKVSWFEMRHSQFVYDFLRHYVRFHAPETSYLQWYLFLVLVIFRIDIGYREIIEENGALAFLIK